MELTLPELQFVRRSLEVRMKLIDDHFNSNFAHSVCDIMHQIKLETTMKSAKVKIDKEIARLEGDSAKYDTAHLVRQLSDPRSGGVGLIMCHEQG